MPMESNNNEIINSQNYKSEPFFLFCSWGKSIKQHDGMDFVITDIFLG